MNSKERKESILNRRKQKREQNKIYKSFDDVFSFNTLYKAGKDCCRNVRWKSSTINFEDNLIAETNKNLAALQDGTYKSDSFRSFSVIEHGKLRHIDALKIQDRQIQRCICNNIMTEAYSNTFVYENGASLPGKGMDFSINLLKNQLRAHYRKYGREGGILQFDFSDYFRSLPHEKIKERVHKHISDLRIAELICMFVDDFQNMRFPNEKDGMYYGVGLGSQVSQNIALDYVSPIDHYIKEVFQIKGYGRYMDDGYIISESVDKLKNIRENLIIFAESLGVKINEKKTKITTFKSHGFVFLKFHFRINENGKIIMKPSRRTVKDMRRKLKQFRTFVDEDKMTVEDVITAYESWRGHIKRQRGYWILLNMDEYFVNLFREELSMRDKPIVTSLRYRKTNDGWQYYRKNYNIKAMEGDKMEYIVHHRLKGITICGEVNLPYGTKLYSSGKFIYGSSGTICAIDSEQGHKYIARNDDNMGLRRGELTYLIAYKPMGKGTRFSPAQASTLTQKYPRFLRDDCDFILFNNKFFAAPIEDLEQMAKDLGLEGV